MWCKICCELATANGRFPVVAASRSPVEVSRFHGDGLHRNGLPLSRLLEFVGVDLQLEAAAGGRSEGLLVVVLDEIVAKQPATGRCKLRRIHARHPRSQVKVWARQGARTWEASRECGIR